MPETIRIDAHSRWDALSLAQLLDGRPAYLVQHGAERWQVCVRGETDAAADEVRAVAERWAQLRGLDATLRVGRRRYRLNGARQPA